MTERPRSFVLQVAYDQYELLGARWWHEGLTLKPVAFAGSALGADASRRAALKVLAGLGVGAVFAGVAFRGCSSDEDASTSSSPPLAAADAQRQYGLLYAADGASFVWTDTTPNDANGDPLVRDSLQLLAAELQPKVARWQPFYLPTLASSLLAPDATELRAKIPFVNSAAMQQAFLRGQALAELIAFAEAPAKWLIVVDLPGPLSVAFAAGLAKHATPVCMFGNWPHPRGVVPAHMTLSALLFHRPQLTASPHEGELAAALVLDRDRLRPYDNASDRFDNRYVVQLPPAKELRDIHRVLYVVPGDGQAGSEQELDDLNETFVSWRSVGIPVRMVGAADFLPDNEFAGQGEEASHKQVAGGGGHAPRHYWGGNRATHGWWLHSLGSRPPDGAPMQAPTQRMAGDGYEPQRRPVGASGFADVGKVPGPADPSRSRRSTSGGSWSRSSGGGSS
ncbi:MAG: hypothetical protein JNN27_14935 [Planctomycetes bacterium]|nr:hypothetical protein [Planctomycetota bacterium]